MTSWMDNILDGLEDGVCVFDLASGTVLQANSAYRRLSSPSTSDVTPKYWSEWLESHHFQQLADLKAAIANNLRHTAVLLHASPDGEVSQLELAVTRLASGTSCMATVKQLPNQAPSTAAALLTPPTPYDDGEAADALRSAEYLLAHSPQPSCVVRVPARMALERTAPDGQPSAAPGQASTPLPTAAGPPVSEPGPPVSADRQLSMARLESAGSSGLDGAAFQWAAYALLPASAEAAAAVAAAAAGPGEGQGQAVAPSGVVEGTPPLATLPCRLADIVYQNTAMLQMCGYSEEVLRAGGLGLLLRPPNRAADQSGGLAGTATDGGAALAALSAALASGTACRTELPCFDCSGRRLWCEMSVCPVGAAGGSGVLGNCGGPQRDWRRRTDMGPSRSGEKPCAAAAASCAAPYAPPRGESCSSHSSDSTNACASACGRGSVDASDRNASSGASTSGSGSGSGSEGDLVKVAGVCSHSHSRSSDGGEDYLRGLAAAASAGAGAAALGGAGAGRGAIPPALGILGAGGRGLPGGTRADFEERRGSITDTSERVCQSTSSAAVALEQQREQQQQEQQRHEENCGQELHRQQRSVVLRPAMPNDPREQQYAGSESRDWAQLCCSDPIGQAIRRKGPPYHCEQQEQHQQQRHHHQQQQQQEQQQQPEQQQEQKQQQHEQRQQQRLQMHVRRQPHRCFLVVINDVTAIRQAQDSTTGELGEQQQQQRHHQHHHDERQQQSQHQRLGCPQRPQRSQRSPLHENAPAAAAPLVPLLPPPAAAGVIAAGCAACQLHDFALDSLREGITLADPSLPDCPIVYTNQAFLTMTGYTREEVLGRNCRFLQGPETDPAAIRTIREAVSRHQAVTATLLNYTKDGARFWNELRLTPVVSPATGQLVAYIGAQNDVTELITRKQSEARLRDAKEAAESATQARSQFLANMSHEIRTPLNGMIATAQLLLGSVLTPEQRELAETILESGSALVGILGDILDFSKIDHGSLELQPRPMCLRQTTEACIELVAAEASKKGLSLAYLIDDAALSRPLLGDPVRIRQVLANLLSNAVKFTERGEVVVRMSVEQDEGGAADGGRAPAAAPPSASSHRPPSSFNTATVAAPRGAPIGAAAALPAAAAATTPDGGGNGSGGGGVLVHITVSDTGIGIDDESASKLFQHFRQGCETMSRRYGGTGLGLAISKRLAQLMRGDIWVDSRKGAGSTFHFTLRAEWAAAEGPWPFSPSRSTASTPPQSSHSTPRTSTDEGKHPSSSGAAAGATLATDGGRAAAAAAGASVALAAAACAAAATSVTWVSSSSSSSTSGDVTRLSNSSSGSGRGVARELRTSPWLPDGTPRDTGDGAGSGILAASVSGGHRTSGGGSCTGGGAGGGADAVDERAALQGRTVLVDVSHAATSTQVWNSCRQLGLSAMQANACALPLFPALPQTPPSHLASTRLAPEPSPSASPSAFAAASAAAGGAGSNAAATAAVAAAAAFGSPVIALSAGVATAAASSPSPSSQPPPQPLQQPAFDILVVSMDRLVPALKAGWKGRPVVALGDRELLQPALQPLVVALGLPVRHSRLATALVKATALLRWNGSCAPKLGYAPIPNESIQTLKSWRLKRGPDWESVNRRTSLDNSALERAAMMRGPAADGGGGGAGASSDPCKSSLVSELSPARQQHAPIPEHSELHTPADDPLPRPGLSTSTCQHLFSDAAPPPAPTPPAPVPSPAGPAAAGSPGEPAVAPGSQQCLEQLRILIAEDNKVNQKVVLKVLQQILRGCQPPDVVENGVQVLQALKKKTYDLILMDIHMPEMDGLEASKRIQETYNPEDRPRIIALSADTVQTLHDRCRDAGIEAFLVKPFRIEELARLMRTGTPRLRRQHEPEAAVCGTPVTV